MYPAFGGGMQKSDRKLQRTNGRLHLLDRRCIRPDRSLRRSLWETYDVSNLTGDVSGLWGDCSELRGHCENLRGSCNGLGDVSGLTGSISVLTGNCTGIWGDCTGLIGDLDSCEISEEDRDAGININDLIEHEKVESKMAKISYEVINLLKEILVSGNFCQSCSHLAEKLRGCQKYNDCMYIHIRDIVKEMTGENITIDADRCYLDLPDRIKRDFRYDAEYFTNKYSGTFKIEQQKLFNIFISILRFIALDRNLADRIANIPYAKCSTSIQLPLE